MKRMISIVLAMMLFVQGTVVGTALADSSANVEEVQVLEAIADQEAPQLVSVTPQHLAGGITLNSGQLDLQMVFDETVTKGTGNIDIMRLSDNDPISVDVSSSQVTVEDKTVTITVSGLQNNTEYYVLMDTGVFEDGSENPYSGILDSTQWRFTTEAGSVETSLSYTSLEPANNTTISDTNPTLSITFNRTVYPGSGNITLFEGSTALKQYSVTSSNVKGGGTNTIEIALDIDLNNNQQYYVKIDSGAFLDEYNNSYSGITSSTEWTFQVAEVGGALAIASVYPTDNATNVSVNVELILTMNKQIQNITESGITLRTSGGSVVASTVTYSNKQIRIKPNSALNASTTYKVNIASGAIEDTNGNKFSGQSNAWSFRTAASDKTAPSLESAVIANKNMIELTYDEDLDMSNVPYTTNYTVTVNGEERALATVIVLENKVNIYLQADVAIGQEIKISYSTGTTYIQDISGNKAASFSKREVTNNVEDSTSQVISSSASGAVIQLTFNETLAAFDEDEDPVSQFTITVDGDSQQPESVVNSGSTLILTLDQSLTDGQVVTVQYEPGQYPLMDTNDTAINGFGPIYVRNSVDTKAPVLISSQVDGARLILNYNEGLNPDYLPMNSYYSVLVNDAARYVTEVEVRNNLVILTLASSVSSTSDSVTLSYVQGIPLLMDLSGNAVPAFSLITVDNVTDTSYPEVEKVTVNGNKIQLHYSKQLDDESVPSVSYFTVRVGYISRSVKSVQVSDKIVTLTISQEITDEQEVYVTYSVPSSNYIQDLAGNKALRFSGLLAVHEDSSTDDTTSDLPSYTSYGDYNLFQKDILFVNTAATTQTTDRSLSGQYVNRYGVDDSQWSTAMEYASRNGMEVVALDLSDSESAAIVAIPLKGIQTIAQSDEDLQVGIRYGDWLYTTYLKDLDFTAIGEQLNSTAANATLLLQIEKQSSQQASSFTSVISDNSGSVIVEPYQFHVSAYTSNKESAISTKMQISYRLTQSLSQAQTTAVRLDTNGGTRIAYVQSEVIEGNEASIVNSELKQNGIISIVHSTRSFTDIGGHWAASDIQSLAYKFIAEARSANMFEPNKAITRGEFATMIVKALGLDGNADYVTRFNDISSSSDAAPYIGAAVESNIITGFTDGTFREDNLITREQMALMINRALVAAGHTISLNDSVSSYLSGFNDYKEINGSSYDAVAKMVHANIIQGMSDNSFGPQEQATRAQAAIMIGRMLNLLNDNA